MCTNGPALQTRSHRTLCSRQSERHHLNLMKWGPFIPFPTHQCGRHEGQHPHRPPLSGLGRATSGASSLDT